MINFTKARPCQRKRGKICAANSGDARNGEGSRIAGERGYFTRTTKVTVKPVPAGMVPVVVQRTFVTQ